MSRLYEKDHRHTTLGRQLNMEVEDVMKSFFQRYMAVGCAPRDIHHSIIYPIGLIEARAVLEGRRSGLFNQPHEEVDQIPSLDFDAVFIVIEYCSGVNPKNVACFDTRVKAEAFIKKNEEHNKNGYYGIEERKINRE